MSLVYKPIINIGTDNFDRTSSGTPSDKPPIEGNGKYVISSNRWLIRQGGKTWIFFPFVLIGSLLCSLYIKTKRKVPCDAFYCARRVPCNAFYCAIAFLKKKHYPTTTMQPLLHHCFLLAKLPQLVECLTGRITGRLFK